MADALREAAKQALEALELHADQYPHMVKGYTADAAEALRAALSVQGEPFKPETWPVDADGFTPDLCTECGTPVRYGSRHSACGRKAMGLVPAPAPAAPAVPPGMARALKKSEAIGCSDPQACCFHRRCVGRCVKPWMDANTALRLRATDAAAPSAPGAEGGE